MARPTKYSEPLVTALCAIIEGGTTIKLACDAVGITTETYNQWNKNNLEFADAVKKARATGAQNLLNDIKTAGRSGTWQASAWILERSYSEHYGRVAVLPAPPTENSIKTKLDMLIEGFKRETHAPDEPDEQGDTDTPDEVEADNE